MYTLDYYCDPCRNGNRQHKASLKQIQKEKEYWKKIGEPNVVEELEIIYAEGAPKQTLRDLFTEQLSDYRTFEQAVGRVGRFFDPYWLCKLDIVEPYSKMGSKKLNNLHASFTRQLDIYEKGKYNKNCPPELTNT